MLKTRLPLLALAALAGCASDPLQDAQLWKIEPCSGSIAADVRFQKSDGSALAVVPSASCGAAVRALGRIEQVAGYRAAQVYVADLDAPNAFASLDAARRPVIVVTLGLLQALGADEAAWAALLGHEIAHHVRSHGAGRKEARDRAEATGQVAANVIAQLFPGIGGFVAGNVANFVAASALYGSYTRPQEAEADRLSLEWMVRAGYDPNGMTRLIEVLSRSGGLLPGFLSTHPGADDRAQTVRTQLAKAAASTCQEATSPLRLETLCLTRAGCDAEIAAIGKHCPKAAAGECPATYAPLRAQCDHSSPDHRAESCALAAHRTRSACAD